MLFLFRCGTAHKIYYSSIFRLEFENLLIFVIPRLCQLSVGQTQELLLSFIKNCSSEQRGFLHNEFKFLLATDIFTLPSIVLNEILSFLDVPSILNLQLVS